MAATSKPRRVAVLINGTFVHDRNNMRGVADYACEVRNWHLLVESDPQAGIPDLEDWGCDGVIASPDVAVNLPRRAVPLVEIGTGYHIPAPTPATTRLAADDEAIVRLAAEHLTERGFRSLAFCGLPRSNITPWATERAKAFRRWTADARIESSVYTGRRRTTLKWATLHRELTEWIGSLKKPLGVIACNDARALHVLYACRELRVRVPDDVAVVGVDNDELLCRSSNPPLSSVELGTRRMGYQAAATLDRMMDGQKPRQTLQLVRPERVMVRLSSDALAIDDPDVATAARFIHRRACDQITVSDVVDEVAVSRSTLQLRFKTLLGQTIQAEIQRVRLEQARELILSTRLPLKQVAARCGFRHVQYMTTLFRRHFGRSPGQYRRACQP
jgi:LacI family transcriptional regulator